MSLVPASVVEERPPATSPGGPATPAGNDEAASAASRAASAVGELVQSLKQAGQNDVVVDELERTHQLLNRVHGELCKGGAKGVSRQAVKGKDYGMQDAATDMMRDMRNDNR
jgi:hypothetical protein